MKSVVIQLVQSTLIFTVNIEASVRITKSTNTNFLLGGSAALERTEVDHWLSFAIGPLKCSQSVAEAFAYLERALAPKTWLVAKQLTIADLTVVAALYDQPLLKEKDKYPHIARWYKQIVSLPAVKKSLTAMKNNAKPSAEKGDKNNTAKATKSGNVRKQEGKFIDLPGAEMGKVCGIDSTPFPVLSVRLIWIIRIAGGCSLSSRGQWLSAHWTR